MLTVNIGLCASDQLSECNVDDFGAITNAHRWPPRSDAARCIECVVAMSIETIVMPFVHDFRDQIERKDLPLMRMSGKLQMNTHVSKVVNMRRRMIEKNRRCSLPGRLERSHYSHNIFFLSSLRIANAEYRESIDMNNLIMQNTYGGFSLENQMTFPIQSMSRGFRSRRMSRMAHGYH